MKHTPTEQAVYEMLVENTGVHMLDSGGAYGRNWQRNQVRTLEDFKNSKQGVVKFYVRSDGSFDIDPSLSVFHFLVENTQYDEQLSKEFSEFAKSVDDHWGECERLWISRCSKFKEMGIDNEDLWDSINTYNGEDLLSQTIQYRFPQELMFSYQKCPILLQIHNGYDVRDGYTEPRVFWTWDCDILKNCDGTLMCTHVEDETAISLFEDHEEMRSEPHYWWTDDAYHFYFQGCSSHKLDEYSALKEETNDDAEQRGKDGLLHVDDDGNGYCPICGGLLEFGF